MDYLAITPTERNLMAEFDAAAAMEMLNSTYRIVNDQESSFEEEGVQPPPQSEKHTVSQIIVALWETDAPDDSVTFDCPICMETFPMGHRVTNSCGHHTCASCMMMYLESQCATCAEPCCSLCRHPMYLLEMTHKENYGAFSLYIDALRAKEEEARIAEEKRLLNFITIRNPEPPREGLWRRVVRHYPNQQQEEYSDYEFEYAEDADDEICDDYCEEDYGSDIEVDEDIPEPE